MIRLFTRTGGQMLCGASSLDAKASWVRGDVPWSSMLRHLAAVEPRGGIDRLVVPEGSSTQSWCRWHSVCCCLRRPLRMASGGSTTTANAMMPCRMAAHAQAPADPPWTWAAIRNHGGQGISSPVLTSIGNRRLRMDAVIQSSYSLFYSSIVARPACSHTHFSGTHHCFLL